MKTRISNRKDGHAVIDTIGDNEAEIKRLQAENKKLKAIFEEWAKANPDDAFTGKYMEDQTDRYAYSMVKNEPALRVQSHLNVNDVVQKLGANPSFEKYVKKIYDADEIKYDFSGSETKRREVENFGLYFTKPEPHLKVEAR